MAYGPQFINFSLRPTQESQVLGISPVPPCSVSEGAPPSPESLRSFHCLEFWRCGSGALPPERVYPHLTSIMPWSRALKVPRVGCSAAHKEQRVSLGKRKGRLGEHWAGRGRDLVYIILESSVLSLALSNCLSSKLYLLSWLQKEMLRYTCRIQLCAREKRELPALDSTKRETCKKPSCVEGRPDQPLLCPGRWACPLRLSLCWPRGTLCQCVTHWKGSPASFLWGAWGPETECLIAWEQMHYGDQRSPSQSFTLLEIFSSCLLVDLSRSKPNPGSYWITWKGIHLLIKPLCLNNWLLTLYTSNRLSQLFMISSSSPK